MKPFKKSTNYLSLQLLLRIGYFILPLFSCVHTNANIFLSKQDLPSDTINQIDSNGDKQGWWIIYDKNEATKLEEGKYIDNKKNGIWIAYYPSTIKKHEITFVDGEAKGPAKFYYEDGKLWESGDWQVDHWIGNYKFYYKTGELSYDWNYNSKGKRTGVQKYFHKNGKEKYVGEWDNGKTIGTLKIYNAEGNLIEERKFDNGQFTSSKKVTVTDESIPIENDSILHMDFMGTGYHSIYNLSGRLEQKGYFLNGKLINGKRFIYDNSDTLIRTEIYSEGKLTKTITN